MVSFLTVDTSHGIFSLGLLPENKTYSMHEPSRQAELLVPEIESLLAHSGKHYADLDALSVCIGPGSFTGIRIGVGAVQGIAAVTKLPVVGITCFEALALSAYEHYQVPVLVLLDAKREQLYVQGFSSHLTPIFSPEMIYYDTIDTTLSRMSDACDDYVIVGNGIDHVISQLPQCIARDPSLLSLPSITHVMRATSFALESNHSLLSRAATPLYIRPPDAKKSSSI